MYTILGRVGAHKQKTNQKSGEESLAEPVLIVIGRSDFWG